MGRPGGWDACEGFWQVEQYLDRVDDLSKAEFIDCLRRGDLELTAFSLHLTELLDAGHLRDSLRPAVEFAEKYGIPLTSAMSCDVNGMSWAMAEALASVGVNYLSTNINPHHGGAPLGGPLRPFYWEARSGKCILVWNGLAYHKANLLGLMGGWSPTAPAGFPGMTADEACEAYVDVRDIAFAERRLTAALQALVHTGYPYRFLPLMGSGLYADNSPPSDLCCEIVAAWNAKHGDRVMEIAEEARRICRSISGRPSR